MASGRIQCGRLRPLLFAAEENTSSEGAVETVNDSAVATPLTGRPKLPPEIAG